MSDPVANPQQVSEFVAANRLFPVVEGVAVGSGAQGAIYWLSSGTAYKLNRTECALLPEGFPRWDIAA